MQPNFDTQVEAFHRSLDDGCACVCVGSVSKEKEKEKLTACDGDVKRIKMLTWVDVK